MTAKITKEMTIEEVMAQYPKTSSVFLKYGFHCVGCPAARFENIEKGARIHGVNVDDIIKELNKIINH